MRSALFDTCSFVVCCVLFVVLALFVGCRQLCVARGALSIVVCCLLLLCVDCCSVRVARWLAFGARCEFFVVVVCWLLYVVCCLLCAFCCGMSVVGCFCCLLLVACSSLVVGCWLELFVVR